MRTRLKKDFSIVAATYGVFLAALLFGVTCYATGYSPLQLLTFPLAPSLSELCDLGEPIVSDLSQHQQATAAFPASLNDLDSPPRTTFFGPWNYQLLQRGTSCELNVGNYDRYGFVVSWTPEGGWSIDT